MKRAYFIALLSLAICVIPNAHAEDVDLAKFASETQHLEQGEGSLKMIWWVPTEYWKESFKKQPNLTQSQKEQFFGTIDRYVIFFVVDAKIGQLGSVTAKSKEDIVKDFKLSVGKRKNIEPLSDEAIASEAQTAFAVLKPLMGNMLGQFGKGMEVICFEGNDASGAKILDPMKEGKFLVKYDKKSYKWRLPLGSLLPPKYDPKSGEKFSGNYSYNPFTGAALVSTPPAKEEMEEDTP